MRNLYLMSAAIWVAMILSIPANAGDYQFYGPNGQYQGSARSHNGINASIPMSGTKMTVPDEQGMRARAQQILMQRQQMKMQQQQMQMQQAKLQQQQQQQQASAKQPDYVLNMAAQKLFTLGAQQKEKYPDFQAVLSNPSLIITRDMIIVLSESKHGVDIAYHLGKNPTESARISSLPPGLQGREITIMDFGFNGK